MRILYFHQHFSTPDGTGGTRSYELARALVARGHAVTMVCGKNDRDGLNLPYDETRKWFRGTVDGIDVVALPLSYSNRDSIARRAFLFLRFGCRSAWLALTQDYDLLFATSTPLTAGIPGIAMKLCGRRKSFVFEVRDLWPELPRALGMKNPFLLASMSVLEWLSYRSADACVGLSPGIVEGIRKRARPGLAIAMVPNGCDLDLFRPGQREGLQLPGVSPNDFVAAFIGAHGTANGLDAVLDAGAVLKQRGRTDIKLVFIGDGREKDRLVQRSKAEGLSNVVFVAPLKKRALAELTGRIDCGLMVLADIPAFYFGTSPNKFFDYISAGIPVVCNYPGWMAEIIAENRCGHAVPPRDPVKFADALCAIADQPSERRQMGRRARELAETRFSRSRLAEQIIATLESVASTSRA